MQRHPLSACFPDISEEELMELANDIKANGQRMAGTTCDGMVLDGWHRFEACHIAGVKFKSVELPSGADPVAFVISQNLSRRHLTASQRAAVVVQCHKWKKDGRPEKPGKITRFPDNTKTNKELAELAKTSESTIKHAKAAAKAGKSDDVLRGTSSASAAVSGSKPVKVVMADAKLAKRVLELEADLEKANAQIESLQESLTDYEALKSDNEHMIAIIAETGDKRLVAALDTIKKLTAQIRVLEERIRSLQGERNMAIKTARKAQKK